MSELNLLMCYQVFRDVFLESGCIVRHYIMALHYCTLEFVSIAEI